LSYINDYLRYTVTITSYAKPGKLFIGGLLLPRVKPTNYATAWQMGLDLCDMFATMFATRLRFVGVLSFLRLY